MIKGVDDAAAPFYPPIKVADKAIDKTNQGVSEKSFGPEFWNVKCCGKRSLGTVAPGAPPFCGGKVVMTTSSSLDAGGGAAKNVNWPAADEQARCTAVGGGADIGAGSALTARAPFPLLLPVVAGTAVGGGCGGEERGGRSGLVEAGSGVCDCECACCGCCCCGCCGCGGGGQSGK